MANMIQDSKGDVWNAWKHPWTKWTNKANQRSHAHPWVWVVYYGRRWEGELQKCKPLSYEELLEAFDEHF